MRQRYYYKSTCPLQCYNLTILNDSLESKEGNSTVHIGSCHNSLFDMEDNIETRCGFPMSAGVKSSFSSYATLFWIVINIFGVVGVFDSQNALKYWFSGRFPLMNVSFHNNTLWASCFEGEGSVRNLKLYQMPRNLLIVVVFPLIS